MENRIFPLRRPEQKIADPDILGVGNCVVAAAVPSLRRPEKRTADTGRLRLGDCMISPQLTRL